jgi:hypothetical protein
MINLLLKYLFIFVSFFILLLQGSAFAWQGRMAGTGDAYGLCEDESDYLIHPMAIASSGKETNFYGTYRLTYDYVQKWDNRLYLPNEVDEYPYKGKGHEWENNAFAGMAT